MSVRSSKSAEEQADYRRRAAAGQVGAVPVAFRMPPPVAPLSPEVEVELVDRTARLVHAALEAWLLQQSSKNTRDTYRRAWQAWCAWCVDHGESWLDPRHGVGAAWLADMEAAGVAAATRRLRMVAVRSAMRELTFEALSVAGDPFVRCRHPKVPDVSTTVPLSDDDVHRALAAATRLGGRHRTLVLLLAVCGLRASEAAQVVEGTVRESPWGMLATVQRKGGVQALVPLPPVIVEAAGVDGWPLDGWSGQRARDRITYLLRQVSEAAGVGLHPHQFRHWHATVALREGVALERVQDSLGHADPVTTQRYNRARNVVENHSAFTVLKFVE